MSEESKTPLTDKLEFEQECGFEVCWEDHARDLKLALAAEREKVAKWKACYDAADKSRDDYIDKVSEAMQKLDQWRTVAEGLVEAAKEYARINPMWCSRNHGHQDPSGVHAALAAYEQLKEEWE